MATSRREIFAQAAKRLRQEFESLRVIPHAGSKGVEAESILRDFLNGHLPKRFRAGAGFIIDELDRVSKQTDVIIYDALNCPVYRASDTAAIVPNEYVAAVVEVKSTLDKEKLKDAVENIAAAKALQKRPSPPGPSLVTTQTLGCIFAFSSSISMSTIRDHYCDLLPHSVVGRHVDIIAVLDRGVVTWSAQLRGTSTWSQLMFSGLGGHHAEGSHLALGAADTGRDTLDAFLRFLLWQLAYFRNVADNRGFDWKGSESGGLVDLCYVASVTTETDPRRREERLAEYAEQARRQFDDLKHQRSR